MTDVTTRPCRYVGHDEQTVKPVDPRPGRRHLAPGESLVVVTHGTRYLSVKGNVVDKPAPMYAESAELAINAHAAMLEGPRHAPHEDDPERCVCGWKPDPDRVALNQRRRAVRSHARALTGSIYR